VAITELVRIIASKAKEIAISLIAIREDEQDGIEMIMEIKGVDSNFLETALESFSLNGREEGIYMIKHLVDQIDVEKKGTSCRIIIKKWKGRNSDLRR
jgi:anti-sigma regulatory factor (Ser/Thr protein kinase)